MSPEPSEAMLLESVLPDLEAEGFEVFAHPSPPILPAFMRDHSPDAIALRSDKKLAIEVLREGAPSNRRLDRLRELFPSTRIGSYVSIGSAPPISARQLRECPRTSSSNR